MQEKKAKEKGRSGAGKFRDGGEQFASVGIFWLVEDLFGGADFQELAGAHDGDARGDLRHHGQAVGNENVRESEFALEFLQQEENLRADGNIEGGYGFVGDDELRLENESSGDADALALAAGEFVRIPPHGVFIQADAAKNRRRARQAATRGEAGLMNGEWLGNEFADAPPRVWRGERGFKHHIHLAPPRRPAFSPKRARTAAP